MLALHWRGDAFTDEQKARDFAYYEALTVRDSSLSACTQAVIAAEVGHLELAYDYFGEAALMDLHDLEHNTRDGVHIASLAGAWIAAVAGFGGMRDHDGELSVRPAPARRGSTASRSGCSSAAGGSRSSVTKAEATYALLDGRAARDRAITARTITVSTTEPVTAAIPPAADRPTPAQPPGVRRAGGRATRRRYPGLRSQARCRTGR